MATQTGSIDLKAAKNAHDEASKKATNYLSSDNSGIMIYDGTNGVQMPSNPDADTRNVFIDSDSVDVRLGSNALATFGEETVIGEEGKARLVFSANNVQGITETGLNSFLISGDGAETEKNITYYGKSYTITKMREDVNVFTNFDYDFPDGQEAKVKVTAEFNPGSGQSGSKITVDSNYSVTIHKGTPLSLYPLFFDENVYNKKQFIIHVTYDGKKTITTKWTSSTVNANDTYRCKLTASATLLCPYYSFGTRIDSYEGPGAYSFSAGDRLIANGDYSHAEGDRCQAEGQSSHAEGASCRSVGICSHAEGISTEALGLYSHCEGASTKTSNEAMTGHAEGYGSIVNAPHAHAQNYYTIAQGVYQTAIGRYNVANGSSTATVSDHHAFIIGNGSSNTSRSNALTVDWAGNVDIASGAKYKINGTALAASDVGAVPTTRTVNSKALSADITLTAADVSAVPTTRKVNNKALSADITLSASDVSAVPTTRKVNNKALSADITLSAADVSAVPTTRKVNNKALSADITLSASDVSAVPTTRKVNNKALSADITLTAADVSAVPTTRKVNNKALSADITLSAADVSAVPTTRTVNSKALSADITLSASDVSAVPTTRTVNSKALSADISLTASDVGAVSDVQLNGTSLKSGTVANLLTSNLVNLLYPIGSCYTTSTNTNPSSTLGGEWSLIHKSYKSQWISSGFTWNTTNTTEQSFVAILNGTTVEFRFVWKNKVAISDNTMDIGTLTPSQVGFAGDLHGLYPISSSDGLNAIGVGFFSLAAGESQKLQILDWVTRAASYPTTTGQSCYASFTVNVRQNHMLDSFCDEFVWKRTS